MRAHKAETVRFTANAEGIAPEAIAKAYDKVMPVMSSDGAIDDAGFARLSELTADPCSRNFQPPE